MIFQDKIDELMEKKNQYLRSIYYFHSHDNNDVTAMLVFNLNFPSSKES